MSRGALESMGGAFLLTGALGLVWLGLWFWFSASPERHPRLSPAEIFSRATKQGLRVRPTSAP